MTNTVIEIIVNIFQSFMFVGFLHFFFEKRLSKALSIAGFFTFVALMFATLTYFTFFKSFISINDIWFYIAVLELYSIIFLKGNFFVRIIMPVIIFFINTVISYLFAYTVSIFTDRSYFELVYDSNIYRNICLVLINATNLLVFLLLLRFRSKNFSLTRWTDVTAFIVIPLLSMVIIYATFYVLILSNYRDDILTILIVIDSCMIAVAVVVWLMISRISKDNEIETKLLLMEQKEKLYDSNVMQLNTQLESMSKTKHDMKNNLLCINELISTQKFDEAKKLCSYMSESLKRIYTPINTDNPLLNAVVNVELEKASNFGIDFKVKINDDMSEFADNLDIVSIIGNLCDNAIEYLEKIPADKRKMKLEISRHNKCFVIICKNTIISSVVKNNPNFETSKEDKQAHGKGIEILKAHAKKYGGTVQFDENQGFFSVGMVIKSPRLPEIE